MSDVNSTLSISCNLLTMCIASVLDLFAKLSGVRFGIEYTGFSGGQFSHRSSLIVRGQIRYVDSISPSLNRIS